jgi:uncharacterized membrane protein HdeD (DUF308 family)
VHRGVAQLVVATRAPGWRWLFVVSGILGVLGGILTVVWPDVTLYVVSILVAWYLVVFGTVQRSLFTLVTLVGAWAIFHGVNEIFAAFAVRETGRRVDRLVG